VVGQGASFPGREAPSPGVREWRGGGLAREAPRTCYVLDDVLSIILQSVNSYIIIYYRVLKYITLKCY